MTGGQVGEVEVEALYRVFSKYRRALSAVAMSADEELETKKRLKRKSLRELDEADAMDATAYCADVSSLKHFLPRMLELGCRPQGEALLGLAKVMLESACWESWPEHERLALEPFRAMLGFDGNTSPGASPGHVELLYFPNCPHVPAAREQLRRAFAAVGLPPLWHGIDVTAETAPAHTRGYGSPSVLVNGREVTGAARGDGASCRLYPGSDAPGAPPLDAIVAALRAALSEP